MTPERKCIIGLTIAGIGWTMLSVVLLFVKGWVPVLIVNGVLIIFIGLVMVNAAVDQYKKEKSD